MAKTITQSELRAKLLDPDTDPEEVRAYFQAASGPEGPFDIRLELNRKAVVPDPEVEGEAAAIAARSAGLLALANGFARASRERRFLRRRSDPDYRGPVCVSEGDSWFQYPIILKDTIDWLLDDFAIMSLDAAGDTIQQMLRSGEYRRAVERHEPDVFLFSAGGNDLLGDGAIVRHLAPAGSATDARGYLLPSFDALVDTVIAGYQTVFATLEGVVPRMAILVHGYDLPIPAKNGSWFGKPMSKHGITDPAMQRAIAKLMMDRFNAGLAALAARFPAVRHLDLRGVVGDSRWHDELHPTDDGYADVAARFRDAINNLGVARATGTRGAALATTAARRGLSLHIGLNENDAGHYGPGLKPLVAAEFDAMDMEALAKGLGYRTRLLLGSDATLDAVTGALRQLAGEARSGDIVLVTYAGHGGKVPDGSGDEADRDDETWCLYDRQLIDDEIYEHLAAFPAGCRVFVISDSCHSGSITRSVSGSLVRVAAEPADDPAETPRVLPPRNTAFAYRSGMEDYESRQAGLAERGWKARGFEKLLPVAASVRLFSGCTDAQVSFDGVANGHFTEQLKRVWDRGRFHGNYEQFHTAIRARMRVDQQSVHSTLGAADSLFDAQNPFQI